MKKIIWMLGLFFMTFFANAQNSWKVKLNGKTVLKALGEDEVANTKKVKRSAFETGTLEILYTELKPSAAWKRTFLFFDENDNELFRKDSVGAKTKLGPGILQPILAGKTKLKIYTVFLPTDPNKAAAIRVRRVHLCTLELQ